MGEKTTGRMTDFTDRALFDCGFHDGTSEAELGVVRDVIEHDDRAYVDGYVRGVLAWKNLGYQVESSQSAWDDMQRTLSGSILACASNDDTAVCFSVGELDRDSLEETAATAGVEFDKWTSDDDLRASVIEAARLSGKIKIIGADKQEVQVFDVMSDRAVKATGIVSPYAHCVNGKWYLSRDSNREYDSLDQYKKHVREAYGDLWGVKFASQGLDYLGFEKAGSSLVPILPDSGLLAARGDIRLTSETAQAELVGAEDYSGDRQSVGHEASLGLEIRKVLVLSTGHLTQQTCQTYKGWPVISEHDNGLYVYVGDEPEIYASAPQDLLQVLEFAKNHGCTEVKFDCDADQVVALPWYDWDMPKVAAVNAADESPCP